jgi:aryl-alcohol dehydrogenase-like predicted oxidoreductase
VGRAVLIPTFRLVAGRGPGATAHPARPDAGINFFDTANIYSHGSSEEILVRALRDFVDRDSIVIAAPAASDPGSRCQPTRSPRRRAW